uniref:Uncharacterized protein n=1 Tax=Timema cristinae TaxID=61476 RepID=A0A7R9D9X5_TIMCR|nr:unnamed protein product [Timema cristinae]
MLPTRCYHSSTLSLCNALASPKRSVLLYPSPTHHCSTPQALRSLAKHPPPFLRGRSAASRALPNHKARGNKKSSRTVGWHLVMGTIEGSEPIFAWRESGKPSRKKNPSPLNLDSSLDLPVLSSLAQHETSTFANYATRADSTLLDPKLYPEKTDAISSYLNMLLREAPWSEHESPLIYVEDLPLEAYDTTTLGPGPEKRSRYYRRYPWKRQNGRNRSHYSEENRYMCNPTRQDVFQLLVALHETRAGNTGKTINFCNRKRPASAIFTNIRFLGRRRNPWHRAFLPRHRKEHGARNSPDSSVAKSVGNSSWP